MKSFFKKKSVFLLGVLTVLLLSPVSCKKKIENKQMYQEGVQWGQTMVVTGSSGMNAYDAWHIYSEKIIGAPSTPPEDWVTGYQEGIKQVPGAK